MSSPEDFRAILRAHRARRGWSQERLAAEAAMDHSLVSRLEGGQRAPTRDAIGKLARALSLTDAQRDRLYLAAGYISPDLDTHALATLVDIVRAEGAPLVTLALQLARAAQSATHAA